MDGIGNYNSSAGSQLLPDTFQIQLPEFAQGVVRDGNRGDFIGVIGRRVDQPLYDLVGKIFTPYLILSNDSIMKLLFSCLFTGTTNQMLDFASS